MLANHKNVCYCCLVESKTCGGIITNFIFMPYINLQILPLPRNGRNSDFHREDGRRTSNYEDYSASLIKRFGFDFIFLKEKKIKGAKNADIFWKYDSKVWEIKTIVGNSSSTIYHALEKAKNQSGSIILDISKSQRDIHRVAGDTLHYFTHIAKHKKPRKILIISKKQYCLLIFEKNTQKCGII